MRNSQAEFRQSVPLFKDLPEDIFIIIDLSHFHLAQGKIEKLRSELESQLKHYVVTYKGDIFELDIPAETHLCALVKGAALTPKQRKLLQEYEAQTKIQGITLVVFQKPLKLIDYKKSALYKKYKLLGLIK